MQESRSAFKIITGKSTEKRSLGRHIWEDNIKIDPKEIGVISRNWIDSPHDRDCWRAVRTSGFRKL